MIHRFLRWYGYRMVWDERGDRGSRAYSIFTFTTLSVAIISLLIFTNLPWHGTIIIPCIAVSMLNLIMAGLNLACIDHWDKEVPDA